MDYISRQDAIDGFFEMASNIDYLCTVSDYVSFLELLSSADVVEVVRCRDCKHYEWTSNRVPEEQTWYCYKHNTEMGNNDYCSYGERKDG